MNANTRIPRLLQLISPKKIEHRTKIISSFNSPVLNTTLSSRFHSTAKTYTNTHSQDTSNPHEVLSSPPRWNHSRNSDPKKKSVYKKKSRQRSQQHNQVKIPTSAWVCVPKIPRYSNLDDILGEVERVMKQELERGILDLDALTKSIQQQQKGDKQKIFETEDSIPNEEGNDANDIMNDENVEATNIVSMIKPKYWDPIKANTSDDTSIPIPPHMVLEARSCLDQLKRPTGWFLRFPNRSVVHALLEHIKTVSPIYCGYFELTMLESTKHKKRRYEAEDLLLDDSVLRLEKVPHYTTESNVTQWFQDFELNHYGRRPPVELLVEGKVKNTSKSNKAIVNTPEHWSLDTHTYLVRFDNPAEARAALREKQARKAGHSQIVLTQYPRQILPETDDVEAAYL